MKFVCARDLRIRSAQIWKRLAKEKELVVTSNGKPVAILTPVSEQNLEESIAAIRRARAETAVAALQSRSQAASTSFMPPKEIDAEIAAYRRSRRR